VTQPAKLRELFLTLSPGQYAELTRDLARLRRQTGASSNTAAIVAAVHAQAETTITPTSKRKAAA
jgi:hypothetical protein